MNAVAKTLWFANRFGWREIFLKPIRTALSPMVIPLLTPSTFMFRGLEMSCFSHPYNFTWATERAIEIPIARYFIPGPCRSGGCRPVRVLEVGNVLSHYGPITHPVVDKFEPGEGVINADIIDYHPPPGFDLIISVSTFEHIGFDEELDPTKIPLAIEHCRSLLARHGSLVITVPTGYNPHLDRMLSSGEIKPERLDCYERTDRRSWEMCSLSHALTHKYGKPYPYANGLVVAQFNAI